jgi:hypothetical protein
VNDGELLGVGRSQGSPSFGTQQSGLVEIDATSLASDESLYFGLLGVDSTGLGFNALHIRLEANGDAVFDASSRRPSTRLHRSMISSYPRWSVLETSPG